MTPPVLLVPGLGNSGPAHWQSLWERSMPASRRVELGDWDHPQRDPWIARLDAAVRTCAEPPILVAHSLGVTAIAWWASQHRRPVHAVLFVAPPDIARPDLPPEVRAFEAPVPTRLGFRATLAASSNAPYCELSRARAFADAWGGQPSCESATRGTSTRLRVTGHGEREPGCWRS